MFLRALKEALSSEIKVKWRTAISIYCMREKTSPIRNKKEIYFFFL
jgi:hypothetical protein